MLFWKSIACFVLSRESTIVRPETKIFSSISTDQVTAGTKYNKLVEWLKSNDAEINEKIDIRPSDRGGGFGAFVTESVAEDELLFTVPRTACLTLEEATGDPNCGEAFTKLIEKAGPGGNTVVMAGFMAKQYLLVMEDEKNGKESDNKWAPYFSTLPWERGVNNQEHILFWSEDMIESLLKGSLCYGEATSLRSEVDFAIKIMNGIVGNSIRVYRGEEVDEGGFSWPWETKPPAPEGPSEGLPEAIKGAFVCLLTRSFQDGDGEGEEEKLVPMLDMLQHCDTPNVRHAMRKTDGTVEVRARCTIQAGEELLNQYRSEEEESMPYSRFFTRFGFVPGIMEPIENLLKDKSSIFYPSVAEV
jgi:SET domain-containing protein 6